MDAGFRPIRGATLLAHVSRDPHPSAHAEDVMELTAAQTAFALDLYAALRSTSDDDIVLGPLSISTALAMVAAGARGKTAREMRDVLHIEQPADRLHPAFNALGFALEARSQREGVTLDVANQAFGQAGITFLGEYLDILARHHGAPLATLDFVTDPEGSRRVINDWAAERTDGRIEQLFPPGSLDPNTRLVLANAVSMDAAWRYVFDPAETRDEPFHLADGKTVDVPTMHFDLFLPSGEGDGWQAVELAYGEGDLSMVVIVPEDFEAFEAALDAERLDAVLGSIVDGGIHLSLPKFTFRYHAALRGALTGLGMATAFGGDADFSGMTGDRDLFLQTVQHEAFIEVDEEGTEAHAATGAAMAASHGPTVTVDRPFLFLIRDEPTGALLFLGRVMDPR
jgi:serpin B